MIKVGGCDRGRGQGAQGPRRRRAARDPRGCRRGHRPGGGTALLYATKALDGVKGVNDDQTRGIDIVRKSLTALVRQIAQNAGHDGAVVSGKLLDRNDTSFGFNASTDTYENLVAAGVIDPTKVVRTALQNAASVAGSDHHGSTVAELPEDKPAMPAGGGMGGMGGMDF